MFLTEKRFFLNFFLIIFLFCAFLSTFFYFRSDDNRPETGDNPVDFSLADPMPLSIARLDCLESPFRQSAGPGDKLAWLADKTATGPLPVFGPLPRGISGSVAENSPGQVLAGLEISSSTLPGNYSLVLDYGQNGSGAEQLCQINLIVR